MLLQRINFLAVPLNLEDIQNGNVDGTVQTISDTVISKLDNCTVLQVIIYDTCNNLTDKFS